MYELCILGCVLLYGVLVEYASHRWTMHLPLLGKNHWLYKNHHVDHHMKGRNDLNVDMPCWIPLLVMLPWIALCGMFAFYGTGVAIGIGACSYAYLWTKLHRQIHQLEDNWVKFCPCYYRWCLHHEKHHVNTSKNFGTIFIFSDYLFGTKI